ncbi:MAG: phage holin family protein [Myxococcota bacterium]
MADTHQRQMSGNQRDSLWSATAELVAAGQQVVLDRVELLRTEISEDLRALAVGGGLVVAAAMVAAFGWVVLSGAIVVTLANHMSAELALGIVGGVHLALGVVLAVAALGRLRKVHAPTALSDAPTNALVDELH